MFLHILIIDSNLENAKKLKYSLQNKFINVYYTTKVLDGIKHLTHCDYQLVIMDVSNGDEDDFHALKMVCGLKLAPVLAISVHGTSGHIARVLFIADDYLQKPIDIEICNAKIQAILRRSAQREPSFAAAPVLTEDNNLLISPAHRKVFLMGTEISLPKTPFDILYLLTCNPRRVFTHELLCERFWNDICCVQSKNALHCQINHLRHRLRSVPNAPEYIHVMRGVGYYFEIK